MKYKVCCNDTHINTVRTLTRARSRSGQTRVASKTPKKKENLMFDQPKILGQLTQMLKDF
uniref:Uncharacterized protein n=1 Tax=Romanomermis culicivorax TaxID=13658 RepID=A0A915JJM5_ROMCU